MLKSVCLSLLNRTEKKQPFSSFLSDRRHRDKSKKVIKTWRRAWSGSLLASISCLDGLCPVTRHHFGPDSFPRRLAQLAITLALLLPYPERQRRGIVGWHHTSHASHLHLYTHAQKINMSTLHMETVECFEIRSGLHIQTSTDCPQSAHEYVRVVYLKISVLGTVIFGKKKILFFTNISTKDQGRG